MRRSQKYRWWKWTRRILLEFFLTAFNVTFFFVCMWTAEAISHRFLWVYEWIAMWIGFFTFVSYVILLTRGRIIMMQETYKRIRSQRIRLRERRRAKNQRKRSQTHRPAA